MVSRPPIPDPTITPDLNELSFSETKPESLIASSAAINPKVINLSIFRWSLRVTILSSIFESFIDPAILQGSWSTSNLFIFVI